MKKFRLAVCTSTPPLKGIYTALFILTLAVPVFSQVEQTDKTPIAAPFHKWEVGFDLKPLFRSDEPYNVLGKWHFTERKAVRIGLGTANWSKSNDTFSIEESKLDNNLKTIQYSQSTHNNAKKMNWNIKIGYQYEFNQGKITVYAATDFDWSKETLDFNTPLEIRGGLPGLVDSFSGYQSIWYIANRKNIYSIVQSLGFKYTLNSYISCAFETSLIGQYLTFDYGTNENPYYLKTGYLKATSTKGNDTQLIFKPLMGLFINYHF
jgi:hypothetical protein